MKINFPLNIKIVGVLNNKRNLNLQHLSQRMSMNMRLNLGGVKDLELKKVFGPEYYVCNLQGVPTSLEEALSSSDSGFWKEAVNDEMDSIISNNTLKLVDLPPGCKTIGYKRVLIRKLKPDGSIENLKPDGSISKQRSESVV